MNFFNSETRKKQKEERERRLQASQAKAQKAYDKEFAERRIQNAKVAAQRDADKLANQKPLHQKLLGAGKALLNDLSTPPPTQKGRRQQQPDSFFNFEATDNLFTWDQPKQKRKRRRK